MNFAAVIYFISSLLAVKTESITTQYFYVSFIDILESEQALMNGPVSYPVKEINFILLNYKNVSTYYASCKILCILFIQMQQKINMDGKYLYVV